MAVHISRSLDFLICSSGKLCDVKTKLGMGVKQSYEGNAGVIRLLHIFFFNREGAFQIWLSKVPNNKCLQSAWNLLMALASYTIRVSGLFALGRVHGNRTWYYLTGIFQYSNIN